MTNVDFIYIVWTTVGVINVAWPGLAQSILHGQGWLNQCCMTRVGSINFVLAKVAFVSDVLTKVDFIKVVLNKVGSMMVVVDSNRVVLSQLN